MKQYVSNVSPERKEVDMKRRRVFKLLLKPLFYLCVVASAMCDAIGRGLISGGKALLDAWEEIEWEWSRKRRDSDEIVF